MKESKTPMTDMDRNLKLSLVNVVAYFQHRKRIYQYDVSIYSNFCQCFMCNKEFKNKPFIIVGWIHNIDENISKNFCSKECAEEYLVISEL